MDPRFIECLMKRSLGGARLHVDLGSISSNLYQGTGYIGEGLFFRRLSARNAVAETPWQYYVLPPNGSAQIN